VLVDVIAMLEVPVAVMDVVHMIAMGDCLAAVSFGVRARVPGMHRLLGVLFVAVHVIDVVVVLDGFAPVPRVVLVINRFGMGRHLSSQPPSKADDTSVRSYASAAGSGGALRLGAGSGRSVPGPRRTCLGFTAKDLAAWMKDVGHDPQDQRDAQEQPDVAE
jgi:hypothetical protein